MWHRSGGWYPCRQGCSFLPAGPLTLGAMPPPESLGSVPIVSSAGPSSDVHSTPPPLPAAMAVLAHATASLAPLSVTPTAAITTMLQESAATVCNLLPSLGQLRDVSSAPGIYVGEGLLSILARLAEKITQWEFVDMAEFLPELWSSATSKEMDASPNPKQNGSRSKQAITDITTWIQCFATYTSVMSTVHPRAVPELLAYLIFILQASQDFGGVSWVTHDAAFRQQAFITGNQQWSRLNPSLYSICFSGAVRTGMCCELCLSLSHLT